MNNYDLNQQHVIITVGAPGSGKTTWALDYLENNSGAVRVNRDDMRIMLLGKYIHGTLAEQIVTKACEAAAIEALRLGFDVICDDTNATPQTQNKWRRLAEQYNARFVMIRMKTPLDVCILRDSRRERSVGEDVVRKFWNQINKHSVKD